VNYNPDDFDISRFKNEGYIKRVEKPWGYELHWTPDNLPYMGKILHIDAGKRLSLQAHDSKQESWMILRGNAKVIWDNDAGELIETVLEEGRGFTCLIGQRHRLVGITDSDILEVSTPEKGTTWRLEDDFDRPDETEQQRTIERS
jgi:mannose-6-phosphate isomerase-like protein (cupin superfamily)